LEPKSRDLKRYSRQTITRLIIGALFFLFVVGGGLILYFYGTGAAALGILCLLAALVPVALIGLILWLMEWIVKRDRSE
jgi:membrane protein YdbS with pleckstrin-like domain